MVAKKKQTVKKKPSSKKAFPKFELFKKLILSDPTITPTEAAMRSYNCKDRKVAGVIGSQNLAKLKITMPELLARMGLTDEEDAKDLKRLRKAQKLQVCDIYVTDNNGKPKLNRNSNDFIEVNDNQTQLKALELTNKLKGRLINKTEHSGEIKGGETKIIIIRPGEKKETKANGTKNRIKVLSR